MSSVPKAFQPIKVGNNTLQHRIVLAPLTRFRATKEAVPTKLLVDYYSQRASPGGLLVTEATFISRMAGGYRQAPGIWNKDQIKQWKEVTSAVHEKGAFIFLQLWHLGRTGSPNLNPNNEQIVSASAIPIPGMKPNGKPYDTPRALETHEVKELVQTYRQAAINAIEAGFDGIEIHNANGYLLDQFVNSTTNKRTDEYGGSIENRTRFSLEVVDAIVNAIGAERTAIRLSPNGRVQGMLDESPVETWGYLTTQLQNKYPNMAYLHFIEARSDFHSDSKVNTVDTLDPYRAIWKGPFISAGGFSTAHEHAVELAENTNNLIAFGRAFIANPDLPERIRNKYAFNKYNRNTFYTHDNVGYTDYPYHHEKKSQL
jgi:2,4-dienoyl-CoA reductase-like NADH-dependent reductase (Old Yellow Enzyme family)